MKFLIPLPPMGKARPRFTGRGPAYMPKPYQQWRRDFVALCPAVPTIDGWFGFGLTVITKTGNIRPDLDNINGAVLDALQDAGIIANDRNLREIDRVRVCKGKEPMLAIELWDVTQIDVWDARGWEAA